MNGFSSDIIKDVFPLSENLCYNTRNKRTFHSRDITTVHFGSETLSHLAPKMWDLVPEDIKKLESVASFKNAIKKWKLEIALAAYAEHIYFRFALCNYFIIQSEAFFHLSFVNTYCTINICTPANTCGWGLILAQLWRTYVIVVF